MAVIGTPIGAPSAADQLLESRVDIITLEFSRHYDETLRQRTRAAAIKQGVSATIQTVLVNPAGVAIDLTEYGIYDGALFEAGEIGSSDSSSSSSSSESQTSTGSIAARLREASEVETGRITADVSVYDADAGIVRVTLPDTVYNYPGIYWLEIAILDVSGNVLYIYPAYVYVERSGWGDTQNGPPSLSSIRMSLRDSDLYENLLIENNDFDTAEICAAAVRAIQFWNEQLPAIRAATFSTRDMPFQDIWLEGTQLYLFQMAEEYYRRNKLEYQAGGTAANDKNRDREYKVAWQERLQMFRKRVVDQKVRINISRGWRTIRQF